MTVFHLNDQFFFLFFPFKASMTHIQFHKHTQKHQYLHKHTYTHTYTRWQTHTHTIQMCSQKHIYHVNYRHAYFLHSEQILLTNTHSLTSLHHAHKQIDTCTVQTLYKIHAHTHKTHIHTHTCDSEFQMDPCRKRKCFTLDSQTFI